MNPTPTITTRSTAGFTLLEMLIALTLSSVIAVMVLGALQLGVRAWEKGEAVAESHHRSRIILDRLRRQLSAATYEETDGADATRPYFRGNHHMVEFTSALALHPMRDHGWVEARYVVDQGPGGKKRLRVFERARIRPDGPDGGGVLGGNNFEELAYGFKDLRFEFMDRSGRNTTLEWHPSWRSLGKKKLPAAIRVTYQAEDHEPIRVIARMLQKPV